MTKEELITKLKEIGVHDSEYSLEDNFEPDTIVLYQNYSNWEIYYFDERGNENLEQIFFSESDAFNFIYNMF